jgi:hypothetical protein
MIKKKRHYTNNSQVMLIKYRELRGAVFSK